MVKKKDKEIKLKVSVDNTEENKAVSDSLIDQKEDTATDFHIKVHVVLNKESGKWDSYIDDVDREGKPASYQGEGEGALESVRALLGNIELQNIKDEKVKIHKLMQLNFDNAKALVLNIHAVLGKPLGDDWFTIYQLSVKTGDKEKNTLNNKLLLLKEYGLVECDKEGVGQRWRIVKNKGLQEIILNKRLDAVETEAEKIRFQLNNLLLGESKSESPK